MATEDISTLTLKVRSDGITASTNKLDKLTASALKAEQAITRLGTQAITMNGQIAGSSGATVALTNAILLLNTNLTQLQLNQVRTTESTRASTLAMRDAHAAARGLAGSLGALWMTYGSAIPLMAGAALGLSIKNVATQGMEFENVMTGIRVKGEVASDQMEKTRQSVLDLGQGMYGPLQVANALETLVMAGLKAEDAVKALAPALNLATVGGTTIEKSAYTLVQVGTAMGYTADSFSIVGDVIAKTAATSMSSVESLSEAFKSASSVGVVYGVTLKDLGVSLALLSNLGIQGSAAGTANKNFYKELDSDAKKVSGTLAKLGVDVERDLKMDGKFKDIGSIVKTLSDALDKAGDKGGKAMQLMTNERGMRQMAALVQAYRTDIGGMSNAFQTAADEINNSAGFIALGAAQISLTTKNQVLSTVNTLKTSFVDAFDAMAPQMSVVSHELKTMFKSEEFQSGLKSLASGFATLVMMIVKATPQLLDLGKAFLVVKSAMFLYDTVFAMARGIVYLTTTIQALSLSALTFSTVFPPMIALMAVAAAGWAAYSYWKNHALDTSKTEQQISTNAELIDSLKAEADRLDAVNERLAKGTDLTKAQAEATRDLTRKEMDKRNASAEAAAKDQFTKAFADVDEGKGTIFKNGKAETVNVKGSIKELAATARATATKDNPDGQLTGIRSVDNAVKAFNNWQKAADETRNSVAAVNREMGRVDSFAKEQEFLAEQNQKKELERQRFRQQIAANEAGNPDVSPEKADPKATARLNALKNEREEMERLTAGYKARTEAIEVMSATGIRAMAHTQEERARAGKFGNDSILISLAREADLAKFEQQKATAIGENANKLTEINNRDIARRAAEKIDGYEKMGMMERTTAAILLQNSASKEQSKTQLEAARNADEVLKIEAAITKLRTATGSSEQRAQGLIDEADAMAEYGRGAKQTAVQLATAEIAKLKLNAAMSQGAINDRMGAAGLEDTAKAYNNLSKITQEYALREETANAIGVEGVIGAESAKVQAHRVATEAIIQSNIDRAKAGVIAAESSTDPTVKVKADETYKKAVSEGKKASDLLKKYFTIDVKVAGLKDISTSLGAMARAANSMGESFAHVGTALDGLGSSFTRLAEVQAAQGISEKERLEGQVGAYGDMAGASASFFQEGSKGYQTMMGVSKIFHAAEMGMMLVRMGQKAVEAVLSQAGGDPYTAFARMAAMAAIVGALGFAVGGGFNSSAGGKSAADVQKSQGTGSVFGDADAKSESITKSLAMLENNSNILLPVNQAMLASLKGIQAAMGGLTNLVLRTAGVTDGSNLGVKEGTLSKSGIVASAGGATAGAVLGTLVGGPIGTLLGSIVGGVVGKLWGKTTQNIVDSGISYGGKVSNLQNGSGYNQYASVDTTKKSFFGLSKKTSNSVQTQGLSDELSSQFGLIFTNLESTLKIAAGALGKNSADVGAAIDNLVLSTTSISLKGLTGDALTSAINAVISKSMDEISEAAFPSMDAFRQVGEGYAETVIRVASGIESAKGALEALGITAINYTAVVNKQGDVGAEMVRQSVVMAETASGNLSGIGQIMSTLSGTMDELVDMYSSLAAIRKQMNGAGLNGNGLNLNVIKGAGSVAALGTALSTYQDKYFTDQEKAAIMLKSLTADFKNLGVALPTSKSALRDLITATGVSTEANAVLTGKLLSLADAYSTAVDAHAEANKTAADALNNTIEGLKKFADSIKEFKDSLLLGDLSTLTPTEKYLEAKKQYESTVAKAMAGDATAQENVTGTAQAFLEASRVVNASDAEYSKTFAQVMTDMDKLSTYAGTQLTDAQKQLEVLNTQADGIGTLNDTAKDIANTLDAMLTTSPQAVVADNTAALAAEIAKLREEAAAAAEAQKVRDEATQAALYDATQKAAATTSGGLAGVMEQAAHSAKTKSSSYER